MSRYRETANNYRSPVPPQTSLQRTKRGGSSVFPVKLERNDVKVSFTVMAHPKRKQWAEDLSSKIPASIVWDRKNDRHDTGLRAIKAYDINADWHVVVQDDVHVPPNFKEGVEKALKWVPAGIPVSFYHGGSEKISRHSQAVLRAIDAGACWLERKGPVWGPAIAYPVDTIPALETFYVASEVENYDRRVMKFYQSIGVNCWYTVPSIVEHRTKDNPSLTGHDYKGIRKAKLFVGPRSVLSIDWSNPVLKGIL